jgi:hypothetical protein
MQDLMDGSYFPKDVKRLDAVMMRDPSLLASCGDERSFPPGVVRR